MADHFKAKKLGANLKARKEQEEKLNIAEAQQIPQRIVDWMNATLGDDHPKCTQTGWRQLHFWLKDGIALCKLVNKLRAAAGLPEVKYSGQNALRQFVALENITKFNKGSLQYGVKESVLFDSQDLYGCHKGPFANVLICLNELGIEANRKGFQPRYDEPPSLENGPSTSDT